MGEVKQRYLNLGCGSRFFSEWENIDFVSTSPHVKKYNLLQGVPYPDQAFNAVYHSHVLEHFSKAEAKVFVSECYRVLKPGGILRVAVPDLEQIIKEYLYYLNQARLGGKTASDRYDWIMLELYDQAVRNSSGGEMGKYWSRPEIIEKKYIASRMGQEFLSFRNRLKSPQTSNLESGPAKKRNSKLFRLSTYRNKLITWFTRDPEIHEYIRIGKFRKSGEIHQWMYDEYSLSRLLLLVGFSNIERKDAFTSNISNWKKNQWLDVEDGKPRKPDSLYIEAIK